MLLVAAKNHGIDLAERVTAFRAYSLRLPTESLLSGAVFFAICSNV